MAMNVVGLRSKFGLYVMCNEVVKAFGPDVYLLTSFVCNQVYILQHLVFFADANAEVIILA
jgi:hypothetical protein